MQVYGSLNNRIMESSEQPEPAVGMGATICGYTDRHPATIIKVTRCQVHVQEDNATRIDKNGMSEDQTYTYCPNPEGRVLVFRKTKHGWKDKNKAGLLIGHRRKYHDFSF